MLVGFVLLYQIILTQEETEYNLRTVFLNRLVYLLFLFGVAGYSRLVSVPVCVVLKFAVLSLKGGSAWTRAAAGLQTLICWTHSAAGFGFRMRFLLVLFFCSVQVQSESTVPPKLPVLWDELRGLRDLVLSLRTEEVGRRQAMRSVESRLRDGELEADEQRRNLEELKKELEEMRRKEEDQRKMEDQRRSEELRRSLEELRRKAEEQSGARAAKSELLELHSRLNSSETSMDELKKKSSALAAELPFLQTRLRATESTVEQLRRKNSDLAVRLCHTETLLEQLRRQISEFPVADSSPVISPDVSETQPNVRLEEMKSNTEALQSRLNSLQEKLNSAADRQQLSSVRDQLSEVTTRLNSSQLQLEDLRRNSADQSDRLVSVENRLKEAERRLDETNTLNTVDSVDVSALTERLSEAERRLDELQEQTAAVSSSSSQDEHLSESLMLQLVTNNSVHSDSVKQLQVRLNSAQHQIHQLQTETTDQTSKLLNLQRKLNTTESQQDEVNTEVLIRLGVGEKQLEDLKTENTDMLIRLRVGEKQLEDLKTENTDQTSKLLNLQRKLNTTESHQDEVNTDVLNRLRVGEKQLEDLKTENTDVLIRLRVGEKQLEDLKTENTGREAELTAVVLRLNVTEQQVDQLRTQNSVRAAELVSVSDRLTAAERNTEELQVRLRADEAEANEDNLKVAFSAGLTDSGSVGPFDEERTLIFSKTITNIGQAYNQTAGVFTAPVRGVYFFSFTAADYLKGYMGLYLYWNDQPIMFNLELNDHGGYASTSNAVALQLEEGDRVRLSLPASYRLYDDNRNFSLFSGFLLFQL